MKLRFKKATVFALVLLLCLGTAGGLWWVWRHSYGYYVTRADEMFEQGRYSRAYALYQAAVWRGSEDDAQIPLLLRMAECVTHYRARTLEQAAENAGKGMHLLEYAAKLNPGNGDVVERYLTNVYQVARTTSLQAFWLRLHERAAALAGSVPPSDVAAKFAAIAQIQLAFQRQEDPDSDDVVEAREVLSDWYDEHPGDVDACFHLGLAELYQALHYRRSGNSEAAVHTARNARGYIRSFVAKHPESFPGKILSAELAVWCRRVGFSEPSLGELHE
ncbi:MAG: hypothetical protein K9N51_14025, partial [Candidatus Pacebacteria bacterium]|nr:hypothetical protein [Candidatus Paceibacterota bacterium]